MDYLRSINREELAEFLDTAGDSLTEDEALAILDKRFCTTRSASAFRSHRAPG